MLDPVAQVGTDPRIGEHAFGEFRRTFGEAVGGHHRKSVVGTSGRTMPIVPHTKVTPTALSAAVCASMRASRLCHRVCAVAIMIIR
ncbi:MAG: hypothetical protein U1E63_00385 [Burkholderiales bacterium]